MKLATVLTPMSDENLQLAAQCGVTDVVHRYPGSDARVLQLAQERIASFGMRLAVVEGYLPIENIKLGCDDGSEIEAMKLLIRQMADLGIRLLCYNFMAGTDWCRTRLDAPERGGAKVTGFDLAEVEYAVRLGYRPPNAEFDALARELTTLGTARTNAGRTDARRRTVWRDYGHASGRSSVVGVAGETSHHAQRRRI